MKGRVPAGRVLVTGASGQVGRELLRRAAAHGLEAVGLVRAELDVADPEAVRRALEGLRPAFVVNAAAYTAVDRAEREPEAAWRANRDGPAALADACRELGLPLLHYSTDYVFDGTLERPYREEDPVAPLNVYGASKAAGEEAVRRSWERHLILRTSWVYSPFGRNFVKAILRAAAEREALEVVADQWGRPTAAADLAEAALALARRHLEGEALPWGTYHLAGEGVTTWHGLAEAVVEAAAPRLGRRVPVRPIATADYPTAARRPLRAVLDCRLARQRLGLAARPWREALGEVLGELLEGPRP